MPVSEMTPAERELEESFARGEWRSIPRSDTARERYREQAHRALKKDRRINIRLSTPDLEGLQKRALEEGIPYQTLIASILHKYVAGRLRERQE